MTGQDAIIKFRRSGVKPEFVWVQDFKATNDGVTISLSPTDTPELLDFRCLVGVTALVEGENKDRLDRLATACGKHANRVIYTLFQKQQNKWGRDEIKILQTTDTSGVMTWQI